MPPCNHTCPFNHAPPSPATTHTPPLHNHTPFATHTCPLQPCMPPLQPHMPPPGTMHVHPLQPQPLQPHPTLPTMHPAHGNHACPPWIMTDLPLLQPCTPPCKLHLHAGNLKEYMHTPLVTTHAPCNHAHPPLATTHAPLQPCMPPCNHTHPPATYCMPPWWNHTCPPRQTTHAPLGTEWQTAGKILPCPSTSFAGGNRHYLHWTYSLVNCFQWPALQWIKVRFICRAKNRARCCALPIFSSSVYSGGRTTWGHSSYSGISECWYVLSRGDVIIF